MKLKYYMRGLGIGMVVTAFILCIVLGGDKQTMTDEEVMARARELGMVESAVLSQIAQQNQNTTPETQTLETEVPETQTPETKPLETEEPETEIPETQVPETEPFETKEPETQTPSSETIETDAPETQTPETEATETVTIVINRGESSVSVSRSLADAGLVESAKEYDRFLCNNGYDKTIAVGTYEIPMGATEEEIAKIITKRR